MSGGADSPPPMRRRVRDRFLWVLKHTLNRATTRLARSGHGPFSLIRHVGRTSGRMYETPVILAVVPGGFVAELTYGEDADWYRNIVAAGGCVVVHRGAEYRVDRIEPLAAEQGRSAYPTPFRQVLGALRRNEYRLLSTEGGGRVSTIHDAERCERVANGPRFVGGEGDGRRACASPR